MPPGSVGHNDGDNAKVLALAYPYPNPLEPTTQIPNHNQTVDG